MIPTNQYYEDKILLVLFNKCFKFLSVFTRKYVAGMKIVQEKLISLMNILLISYAYYQKKKIFLWIIFNLHTTIVYIFILYKRSNHKILGNSFCIHSRTFHKNMKPLVNTSLFIWYGRMIVFSGILIYT